MNTPFQLLITSHGPWLGLLCLCGLIFIGLSRRFWLESIPKAFYGIYLALAPQVALAELNARHGVVLVHAPVRSLTESTLTSPYSNKNCLYYHIRIEEKIFDRGRHYWTTIEEWSENVPMALYTEEQVVQMDWQQSDLHLESQVYSTREMPSAMSREEGLQFRHYRPKRVIETLIEPNQRLYVLGHVSANGSDLKLGKAGWLSPMRISTALETFSQVDWDRTALLQFTTGCMLLMACKLVTYALTELTLFCQASEPESMPTWLVQKQNSIREWMYAPVQVKAEGASREILVR